MSEPIRDWTMPDQGEGQEGLAAGDLSSSNVCALFVHRAMQEEYYRSPRYEIGYRELQAMWTGESDGGRAGGPLPISDDVSQMSLHLPSNTRDALFSVRNNVDTSELKRSLVLPLKDYSKTSSSTSETSGASSLKESRTSLSSSFNLEVPPFYRSRRNWSSSAGASPLGTPSPVLSEAPSPLTSSPCESMTSSPRLGGGHSSRKASTVYCSDLTSGSTPSGRDSDRKVEDSSKSSKQKSNCVIDKFRRLIQHLRGQRAKPSDSLQNDSQIAELEYELESYRQLSESKRRAADLLKHQLMEVLYEKVVSEVEEKHKRRHLEEEMMGLEFELHLLRSNTEESIRMLKQQLERVITEKISLQRQVNFRPTEDLVPDYSHLFSHGQGQDNDVDGTIRRASH